MKKSLFAILVLGSVVALESPRAAEEQSCATFKSCMEIPNLNETYGDHFQGCMKNGEIQYAGQCEAFKKVCGTLKGRWDAANYRKYFPSCSSVDPE